MDTPLVSIYCLAYNHEKYIECALNGMISQKTTFPFEIIVHDDASTDGTARIIREYAERYPDIIRPIYQTENQYSKKVPIIRTIIEPRLRGKYIAVCEGDDYWTCEDKLQLQVDVMEREPNCQMCTHAFSGVNANSGEIVGENHALTGDGWLDPGLVIEDIQSPQTATFLFRAEILKDYPAFFRELSVGDYPRRVYCAVTGGIYYIDQVMSCYRKFSNGSWTARMTHNPEAYKLHLQKMIVFLERLDEFTQGKYHENTQRKIDFYKFISHIRFGSTADALRMNYFKNLPAKRKVINFVMYKWPKMWYRVLLIRNKLFGNTAGE